MPYRRYARRFSLSRMDPGTHLRMLRLICAPKYIRTCLERAPAAIDALLDPRRRAPPSRSAKGCVMKGAR